MTERPVIEVRTGSTSDIPRIAPLYEVFEQLDVPFEPRVLSAHRTPESVEQEARKLGEQGFRVSVAAAGGSAHLPGKTASYTSLPVIGLPVVTSTDPEGRDAFGSIIQMPRGVPTGTVGPGQAEAAALLAAQMAYLDNSGVRQRIREYRDLDGPVPGLTNEIGIVRPYGWQDNDLSGMTAIIEDLGINTTDYIVSPIQTTEIQKAVSNAEEMRSSSLIVIGYVDDDDEAPYLPRMVSEHTDIPVIGVVHSTGYQERRREDPRRDMLEAFDPEDPPTGYPVAGMGLNGLYNAGLFAGLIVGAYDADVQHHLATIRGRETHRALAADGDVRTNGISRHLHASV